MDGEEHLESEQVVELMMTQSETEANIVRSLLEGSGIDCLLVTPVPHSVYPFTVDGLATIRIKVLESQLEAARALLQDYESNAEPDADDSANGDTEP